MFDEALTGSSATKDQLHCQSVGGWHLTGRQRPRTTGISKPQTTGIEIVRTLSPSWPPLEWHQSLGKVARIRPQKALALAHLMTTASRPESHEGYPTDRSVDPPSRPRQALRRYESRPDHWTIGWALRTHARLPVSRPNQDGYQDRPVRFGRTTRCRLRESEIHFHGAHEPPRRGQRRLCPGVAALPRSRDAGSSSLRSPAGRPLTRGNR